MDATLHFRFEPAVRERRHLLLRMQTAESTRRQATNSQLWRHEDLLDLGQTHPLAAPLALLVQQDGVLGCLVRQRTTVAISNHRIEPRTLNMSSTLLIEVIVESTNARHLVDDLQGHSSGSR